MPGNVIWSPDVPLDLTPDKRNAKFSKKNRAYGYMGVFAASAQFTPEIFVNLTQDIDKSELTELSFRGEMYLICKGEDGNFFTVQATGDKSPNMRGETSVSDLEAQEEQYAAEIIAKGSITVYLAPIDEDSDELTPPVSQTTTTSMAFSPGAKSLASHHSSDSDETSSLSTTEHHAIDIKVTEVYTPKQFAELKGFNHVRIPTANGKIPTDADMDIFLEAAFSGDLKQIWAHCHGGNSRTAMYMAMYDAIYLQLHPEAQQAKEEFIKQGGEDPWQHPKIIMPTDKKTSKNPNSLPKWQERDAHLKQFIKYMDLIKDEPGKEFKVNRPSWSERQSDLANANQQTRPSGLSF